MSFREVGPEPLKSTLKKTPPVIVGLTARGKTVGRWLTISIALAAVPECAWLRAASKVKLLLGEGDDAGVVRIAPGGNVKVVTHGPGNSRVIIRSGLLACTLPVPNGKMAPEAVDFDYGDDWIDITLPLWTRGTVTTPRASAPPASPTPSVPFKGALAGGIVGAAGRPNAPLPMGGTTRS